MRKILYILLTICVLLSGCTSTDQQSAAPENPGFGQKLSLLEQGIPTGESGNLLYIPNETVEATFNPELRLFNDSLLVSSIIMDETRSELHLWLVSLKDGSLQAERVIQSSGCVTLQIGQGCIGLCDSAMGTVQILDENLQTTAIYEFEQDGCDWYLTPDMERIYIVYYDRGIISRNLKNGEETGVISNAQYPTVIGQSSSYLMVKFIDTSDQLTKYACIEMDTGLIESLPSDGNIDHCSRMDNTWLLRDFNSPYDYKLVSGDQRAVVHCESDDVQLISGGSKLLTIDEASRRAAIYSIDGAGVSEILLSEDENGGIGRQFVYSGYWQGYFFTDLHDGKNRLMFWNPENSSAGENLEVQPEQNTAIPENPMLSEYYRRAKEMSERFGIDIRIAEQCSLDYTHYRAYALTNNIFLEDALDTLDNALSNYPEGFFRQIGYDNIKGIRIEIVGGLSPLEGSELGDAGAAFAQVRSDCHLIVFDGFMINESTVYHEVSHVIDKRLAWDAYLRDDALFSEEKWLELQPEGFEYACSYTEMPAATQQYSNSGYFVKDYSRTFPTEDRATIMEAAMSGWDHIFEENVGLHQKLKYYGDCIRDCFDTSGWPEITVWEQAL